MSDVTQMWWDTREWSQNICCCNQWLAVV